MVGSRVLTGDDDQLRLGEVVEAYGPLADPDGLAKSAPARLVAEIRAVGQVVRAELADEELVEERRLVARAPARVEDRLVRAAERVELRGDEGERVVPGDRLIVRRSRTQHHRMREPPLLAEPVIALSGKLRHAVAGKELRRRARRRTLLGDRLDAVLAELEGAAAVVRVRPGAARTVVALELVELPQELRAAQRPGLPGGVADGSDHSGQASCPFFRRLTLEGNGRFWRLRARIPRVGRRRRRRCLQAFRHYASVPRQALRRAPVSWDTGSDGAASSSSNQKRAPPRGPARTPRDPPCDSTSRFTVARPRPIPGAPVCGPRM